MRFASLVSRDLAGLRWRTNKNWWITSSGRLQWLDHYQRPWPSPGSYKGHHRGMWGWGIKQQYGFLHRQAKVGNNNFVKLSLKLSRFNAFGTMMFCFSFLLGFSRLSFKNFLVTYFLLQTGKIILYMHSYFITTSMYTAARYKKTSVINNIFLQV